MLDKDEQKLRRFFVRKSNHNREREGEWALERVQLCESSEDLLLSWASEKFQFNWMHPHYGQPSDLKPIWPSHIRGAATLTSLALIWLPGRRRSRNRAGHLATIWNWKNIYIKYRYIYIYPASNWMLISDSTAQPACRAPPSMLSWKGFVWVYSIPFYAVSYFRPKIMAKTSSACDCLRVSERETVLQYNL